MFRLSALVKDHPRFSQPALRYGIAVASITVGAGINLCIQMLHMRDPLASILLLAITVSTWYGGQGPGILSVVISTLLLDVFLPEPGRGLHRIGIYDALYFCVFLGISLLVHRVSRQLKETRHALVTVLSQRETEIAERTKELWQVNAEYQTIFDHVSIGIALLGPDRLILRCNRAYEKMLGYAPGEAVGKRAPLPESEKQTWQEQEKALRRGKELTDHEAIRIRKDGSEFCATISATPLFDKNGEFIGIVGMIIDNTERNAQANERQMLTSLVQHSPYSIGVATPEGQIVALNPSGKKMFGREDDEQIQQTHVRDYLAPSEQRTSAEKLIADIKQQKQLEIEILGRNSLTGMEFPLHCTCFVIPHRKTGEPAFIAGISQDITERKRAEEELRRRESTNRHLLEEVKALQEQLRRENASLKEEILLFQEGVDRGEMFEEIIGSSPALKHALDLVEKIAPTDTTVLITGETGTGKELIARAIHMASGSRADKPFIPFNCAALPPSLISSELFGHEKGAFTGAEKRRRGRFDIAEGGTLFLDEVADMPFEAQAILLRVLQEHEFERVGSSQSIHTDVRVIAATNRDLQAAVREHSFREDLFYRLTGFHLEMPPLRERREDIPALVRHFAQEYAHKLGKKISGVEKRSMEILEAHNWPGNVRELQNFVQTSVILCDGDTLIIEEHRLFPTKHRLPNSEGPSARIPLTESRLEPQRPQIEEALRRSRGKVGGTTGAAAMLNLPPSTLRSRITSLRIDRSLYRKD
jgi:PAS domain S-box-containing protein